MKERLNQLFMSKEQTIYLLFLFVESVVYGMFAATFTYYQIGLGSRFYSLIISTGCIVGCIHAFISADIKKKKWVFIHYRIIDLCESIFFTLTEAVFATYYFVNGFNPLVNEKPILSLGFFWSIFVFNPIQVGCKKYFLLLEMFLSKVFIRIRLIIKITLMLRI